MMSAVLAGLSSAAPVWPYAVAAGWVAIAVGVGVRGVVREQGDPWRWRWLLVPQVAFVLAAVALAYMGAFSSGLLAGVLPSGADKVLHFILFGALSLWTHFAVRGRTVGGRLHLPIAVLVPLALAVAEEAAQAWSPNRSADPLDLLCDALGMVVAWRVGVRLTRSAPRAIRRRLRPTA